MNLVIEIDREADGRWIAEIPSLPGVITYGSTQAEAIRNATALARQVISDRRDNGEDVERGDL
jgi:predicted RNase H-like HicB family nuclease